MLEHVKDPTTLITVPQRDDLPIIIEQVPQKPDGSPGWPFDCTRDDWLGKRKAWREITEEDYYYCLNVLPPMGQNQWGFLMSESYTSTRNGEIRWAIVDIYGRFFMRLIPGRMFTVEAERLAKLIGTK